MSVPPLIHARRHKQAIEKCSAIYYKSGVFSSGEFVLLKLKKEATEEGTFLVRWSAIDYNLIILAVLNKNKVTMEIFAVQCSDDEKYYMLSFYVCVAHRME